MLTLHNILMDSDPDPRRRRPAGMYQVQQSQSPVANQDKTGLPITPVQQVQGREVGRRGSLSSEGHSIALVVLLAVWPGAGSSSKLS